MKYALRPLILVILLLFTGRQAWSQSKDSAATGTIRGLVKDSVLNYYLQAASVAVYRVDDKTLAGYSLTNSLGEYRISGLRLKQRFQVRISFIGYESYSRIFTITSEQQALDLGTIFISKSDKVLDEVTVTAPPVRMNGDTLEFSASAFQLDPNAVAEDLLKKLPGIIIWGDGTITVNGRPIDKLLVDGKPFFGGDTKIATQNIPKTAISKVQVYQEYVNPFNPYDSITAINLKLKKGYKAAYFGSISAGRGTDNKYEVGINNSLFAPRTQLSVVGQGNNVNRLGNDITTLLRNGTFKGTGARIEYQPDFNMRGLNEQVSGGYFFTHDLIPDYTQYRQSRLSSSGFASENRNNTIRQSQLISFIGKDSSLDQSSSDSNKVDIASLSVSAGYNKKTDLDSFTLKALYRYKSLETEDILYSQAISNQQLLNTSKRFDDNNAIEHGISFIAAYDHHGFKRTTIHKLLDWTALYSFNFDVNNTDRLYKIDFTGLSSSGNDLHYYRKYDNRTSVYRQELDVRIGDFSTWLFGESRLLSRFNILLENSLSWSIEKQNNIIGDINETNGSLTKNAYLSNIRDYGVVNEKAGIKIGRVFTNMLTNRYQKDLSVYLDTKAQLYNEKVSSLHSFQYFNNSYYSFIPSFNLGYTNYQYGEYVNRYSFSVDVTRSYPSPEQRFPLIDSSQIYDIRAGNSALTPQTNYVANLRFGHEGNRTKNTINYGVILRGGIYRHFLADSIVIDQAGRYTFYTINTNDHRFLNATAQVKKAFVKGFHQIQLSISAFFEKSRTPSYFGYEHFNNSGLTMSNITVQSDSLSLYYTWKDVFALNISQSFSYYHNRQQGFLSGSFENKQIVSNLGIGYNFFRKAFLSTNINYNYFYFSNSQINQYTIWNASASYRLLKSNNIELKLAALDILKQNKGIVNFGNSLSVTHQNVNLLQQYFMVTATYYPRKFGSKGSH